MNKKHFKEILLQKHLRAEGHLEDRAFKLSTPRYKRKDFIEGYKYCLIEIQQLVETFHGDTIHDEKRKTIEADKEFLEQIRHKA
jgi:hypothetical protein